jgi:hypothetical protein
MGHGEHLGPREHPFKQSDFSVARMVRMVRMQPEHTSRGASHATYWKRSCTEVETDYHACVQKAECTDQQLLIEQANTFVPDTVKPCLNDTVFP